MVRYNIYNKGSNELFNEIATKYNIDKAVARIIVNRDVALDDIDEYLNPDINKLNDPYLLMDVTKAADIARNAIDEGKKIRIIGDYDVDGVMATYVLLKGLRNLGANVDYQIPHRVEDGYGLNANIINHAIEDKVNLIITCDNGVSAIDEIQLAKDNGIDVIITDHHELMFEEIDGKRREVLPNANALINPKREGDKYPFKKLCGAAVAWKFLSVLYDKQDMDSKLIMSFIEEVAFATIGDVMELVGENRIIVRFGLDSMAHTKNIGLRHLIEDRIGKDKAIVPYHIGFVLGPCINASGRLDSASKSLELLLAEDDNTASNLTRELVDLNEERKLQTLEGTNKAIKLVDENYQDDKILVVYIPEIHESVAGIVAGRIREKYSKPTIILCDGESCVKGSGRSIESYNMYEGLHSCKELFLKFGGHPMAAGMSLPLENVDKLRNRLNKDCTLTPEELVDIKTIDMTLNLDYITCEIVEQLDRLEPFGNGNSKPVFAHKNAPLRSIRRIGSDSQFFKMEFQSGSGVVTGLYFQDAKELEEKIIDAFGKEQLNRAYNRQSNDISLTIMFYPQINEYNNRRSVQLVLSDVVC